MMNNLNLYITCFGLGLLIHFYQVFFSFLLFMYLSCSIFHVHVYIALNLMIFMFHSYVPLNHSISLNFIFPSLPSRSHRVTSCVKVSTTRLSHFFFISFRNICGSKLSKSNRIHPLFVSNTTLNMLKLMIIIFFP